VLGSVEIIFHSFNSLDILSSSARNSPSLTSILIKIGFPNEYKAEVTFGDAHFTKKGRICILSSCAMASHGVRGFFIYLSFICTKRDARTRTLNVRIKISSVANYTTSPKVAPQEGIEPPPFLQLRRTLYHSI
jgi:hypothetical protein